MTTRPTDANDSDDFLMRRAAAGDTSAFGVIIRQHQETATRTAIRLLGGDRNTADDVVQEAFLRLWRTAAGYEARGQLRAYLLRIVCNLCADFQRKKPPTSSWERCIETPDNQPTTDETLHRRLLAEAVRNAVACLPESQRAVFILSEYEGLSYREIAEILGVPIGTVGSRKHLATEALRERLRPYLRDDEEGEQR
jgi:RNA polymerase sigma-70 factor, ECF subfamily